MKNVLNGIWNLNYVKEVSHSKKFSTDFFLLYGMYGKWRKWPNFDTKTWISRKICYRIFSIVNVSDICPRTCIREKKQGGAGLDLEIFSIFLNNLRHIGEKCHSPNLRSLKIILRLFAALGSKGTFNEFPFQRNIKWINLTTFIFVIFMRRNMRSARVSNLLKLDRYKKKLAFKEGTE